MAVVLAGMLTLAPVLALVWATQQWVPAGDSAIIGFRALDVGTARTPLVGQPSTAGNFVGAAVQANHPGPLHFYTLAPVVRLVGASTGMPLVSAFVGAVSLVVAGWAVFRQLGAAAGVWACVVLGSVSFTIGSAWFVSPSNAVIVVYPMLCTVVLAWCVVCGDVRLLPLGVGFGSFAAQQHLSVLPTLALVAGVAVSSCVVRVVVARRAERAGAVRWLVGSMAVGGVLWSPVLWEQATGRPGNLWAIARFATTGDRATVGLAGAVRQVAHAVGLPPLLGRLDVTGRDLLAPVSLVTALSALMVLAGVGVVGASAWRAGTVVGRRLAAAAGMVGVLIVAGLVNGAAVPVGPFGLRLDFFHWVWPLVFFVVLTLGVGLAPWLARAVPRRMEGRLTSIAVTAAVLMIAVPAAANPYLDRPSSTLVDAGTPVSKPVFDQLAGQVLRHRRDIAGPTMVLTRGDVGFADGVGEALALALWEHDVPVRHAHWLHRSFHPAHLVRPNDLGSGLVLWQGYEAPAAGLPGRLIADVDGAPGFDHAAFLALVDQVRAGSPLRQLLDRDFLGVLEREPLVEPQLDRGLIRRVRSTLPPVPRTIRLRVYLLTADELRGYASPHELGPGQGEADAR